MMAPAPLGRDLLRSLLIGILAGAALTGGCAPEGARSVHIGNSKDRKQGMLNGGAPGPTPVAKPNAAATAGKPTRPISNNSRTRAKP